MVAITPAPITPALSMCFIVRCHRKRLLVFLFFILCCSLLESPEAEGIRTNNDEDDAEIATEWLKKIRQVWDNLNRSLNLLQKVLAHLDRNYLMNSNIGRLRYAYHRSDCSYIS